MDHRGDIRVGTLDSALGDATSVEVEGGPINLVGLEGGAAVDGGYVGWTEPPGCFFLARGERRTGEAASNSR